MSEEFSYYGLVFGSFVTIKESLDHVNDIVFEAYEKYYNEEQEKLQEKQLQLTNKEMDEIRNVLLSFQTKDISDIAKEIHGLEKNVFDTLIKITLPDHNVQSTKLFIRKMSIVFLITSFEEFLKKIFSLIFINNSNSLKSGMQISSKEILESESYEKIVQILIERKTKEIINKNPDDLEKILSTYFDFDLENDKLWKSVREVFYRRHAIVHNNGNADEEYKENTNNPDLDDLSPTKEYVNESLESFYNFAEKITRKAEEKFPQNIKELERFGIHTRINELI